MSQFPGRYEEDRNDEDEVVLEAMRESGAAVEHASQDLRAGRGFGANPQQWHMTSTYPCQIVRWATPGRIAPWDQVWALGALSRPNVHPEFMLEAAKMKA